MCMQLFIDTKRDLAVMETVIKVVAAAAIVGATTVYWFFRKAASSDCAAETEAKSSPNPYVTKLFVYPIKSCRGYECTEAEFDRLGFIHDRRFCLVDANGLFLTARQFPKMALIKPSFEENQDGTFTLVIEGPGLPLLHVHPNDSPTRSQEIKIWNDRFTANICADEEVNEALSRFLSKECFLAAIADNHNRPIKDSYYAFENKDNVAVHMGDGFPFLMVSEASFKAVQRACPSPISLENFRPNIVVDGCDAFNEDTWKTFTIGRHTFHNAKPCERCILTTVNPQTGEKDRTGHPLLTLREIRSEPCSDFGKDEAWWREHAGRPLFGVNLLQEKAQGSVKVGDMIHIHAKFGPYVAPKQ